jgi:lipoyl(octanoyl) transferase
LWYKDTNLRINGIISLILLFYISLQMATTVVFRDLGLIPYLQAWAMQEELFAEALDFKLHPEKGSAGNHLLFCSHPHVYTVGKSGKMHNLLVDDLFLDRVGATLVRTNRGGDITYHGPGQLVGYPVFDLEQFGLSIKDYVHLLEECIIRLLENYGIAASRVDGATGVWLGQGSRSERKICAIGVRASRYVSMHGFALNINTELKYFSYINPCGFIDKGVTSLQKELSMTLDEEEVKQSLKGIFAQEFGISFTA